MTNFWTGLEKTQNRDQLCKCMLYVSKIISVYLSTSGRHEQSLRFHLLSTKMDDSRKLFRLLKSIEEVKKMKNTYYSANRDKVNKFIDICIYRCYFSYWLFDNLAILVKYCRFDHKRQDQPYYNGLA